jgi:glutathione peroxidase
VNGEKEHPIYNYLKTQKPGILGLKRIKWNFEKFLVDKEGNVVKRYPSTTTPEALEQDVLKYLA